MESQLIKEAQVELFFDWQALGIGGNKQGFSRIGMDKGIFRPKNQCSGMGFEVTSTNFMQRGSLVGEGGLSYGHMLSSGKITPASG